MNLIDKLRARRKQKMQAATEKRTALAAALEKMEGDEKLTDDERTLIEKGPDELNGLMDEVDTIETRIKAVQRAEAKEAADAEADDADDDDLEKAGDIGSPAQPKVKLSTAGKLGLLVKTAAQVRLGHGNAKDLLDKAGYGEFAKSMDTGTDAAVVLPPVLANEIIEYIRPRSAFLAAQPRRVQFTAGQFNQAAATTGSMVTYVGEGQEIGLTQPGFGAIAMRAKKMAAITPMTREVLKWALPALEAYVEQELRDAAAQAKDLQALRGVGSAVAPTGIFRLVDPGHIIIAPAGADHATINRTLARMGMLVRTALQGMRRPRWFMNETAATFLQALLNAEGGYAFPTMQNDNMTLMRIPVSIADNLPNNLGAGLNETEIGLFDMDEVYYAEEPTVGIDVSTEATLPDGAGGFIHLFSQDMLGMRYIEEHDMTLRRAQGGAVLTEVNWQL